MKAEIKTFDDIQEISLEGFKTVSSDMFYGSTRPTVSTLTLWRDSISFNKASFTVLNCCERIRIEVNSKTKRILAIPVTTRDRDGIKWIKDIKHPAAKKLFCSSFTTLLFKEWGLSREKAYRTEGHIVAADQKVMMLYDFTKCESWITPEGAKKDV